MAASSIATYKWKGFAGALPDLEACAKVSTAAERSSSRFAVILPLSLLLLALISCTWASFYLGQGFAFTGFLYLVLVVLAALYGGFWQATVISVAAAGCLNYFFVPPIFSFVNSAANWVALGAFEFTALVISRLSLRAQLQATEAIAGRREVERLYETSKRILLLNTAGEASSSLTSLIREIFGLKTVQLYDASSGRTYQSGIGSSEADCLAKDAYLIGEDSYHPSSRTWCCVLRVGTRPVGGLALCNTGMTKLAATALASLGGIALERVLALERESHAQAARETEQLRTAVLDALAHQFKTPLTIARTASSGLLALGGLSELQIELVSEIDQQANKLDHLASRLLRAAMLDSEEFQPRRESLWFSQLIAAAVKRLDEAQDRERIQVSAPDGEIPVFADRELIVTSLVQLIDNAIKYSEPESPIEVTFEVKDSAMVLKVRSKGLVVTRQDRDRIFERFYRAPETQHLPTGTGLGLSIVKKIVEAHQGHVWADGEADFGTSFSLSLPAAHAR
jgi:two-component system, OmpR family, sensor histidine kinase KdpD